MASFSKYGGGSIDLDSVDAERGDIETGIFVVRMPGTSNKTYVKDFLGKITRMRVMGIKVDTIANLQTWLSGVETYCNGDQGTGGTYASDLTGNRTGLVIERFTYEARTQEGFLLHYQFAFVKYTYS